MPPSLRAGLAVNLDVGWCIGVRGAEDSSGEESGMLRFRGVRMAGTWVRVGVVERGSGPGSGIGDGGMGDGG